ncbi:hypothetical protein AB833_20025 [Chromatiales bacterium (ex Bugula neritina AB1)]|nr:hypothetical protein AB833_20025 [Chromatiales bacterium (ex Bugula neritina AB1)]
MHHDRRKARAYDQRRASSTKPVNQQYFTYCPRHCNSTCTTGFPVSTHDNTNGNPILRDSNFRRYYIGVWFYTSGFWVLKVAIGWAAWELSHSAYWTGLVAAAYMAPAMILSPVFGVMADRMRLKRGVLLIVTLQVLMGASLALASFTGWLTIERLAVFSLLYGTLSAAYHPIRLTIVGRLVRREMIPATVGLNAIAFNTARIIGPALAGLLLAAYGTATALLCGSLLYLPHLLLFSGVTLRSRTKSASDSKPWYFAFGEGLAYAIQLPIMAPVVLFTLINGGVGRSLFEILPAVVGDLLLSGAETLATLTAAAGAGAILAGLTIARFKMTTRNQLTGLIAALVVCCITTLVISFTTAKNAAALLCAVAGFSTTFVGVSSQSLLQLALADEYRGRVMSLWTTVSFGAPAIGALLIGLFAETYGLGESLAYAATAGVVLSLIITPLALSRVKSDSRV